MQRLGFTRSASRSSHLLLTPDTFVRAPRPRMTNATASLPQRHGFSPYIGETFRGVVRRTVLRGPTIFADGKIVASSCGRMMEHAKTGLHP